MMIGLLAAGILAILVGAVAIAYGIMLDLSFGNTLILAGAFGLCSGMIVLAQAVIVRELRNLGRKLGARLAGDERTRSDFAEDAFALPRDLGAAEDEDSSIPGASAPWRDDGPSRDRMRQEPGSTLEPPPDLAEPALPPLRRRNLMFSSTVRKDRERPELAGEPAAEDQVELPEAADAQPDGFEDAWPRAERPLRPSEMMAQRRAARAALDQGKAPERPPFHPMSDEPPSVSGVTVIKSGIVEGMAYSLYSDGSIEAQMPEGMMRFTSIDDLRAHLDQR